MSKQPWFKDGLRFQCSQCGDCCTGAPGHVWVNNEEMQAIADELDINVDQFRERYTRKIGIRYSLKELPNCDCVFFDGEKRNCNVYEARPRQCRTWPFWDSNLKTPEDWQQTCKDCPGSGKGKLYQLDQIERKRKTVKI